MDRLSYQSGLYWIIVLISGLVVYTVMGPGLWTEVSIANWYGSWQKQAFDQLCHQIMDRTMYIHATPMAVCSRCFGIYLGFFVVVLLMPLIPQSSMRNLVVIPIVLVAITLNVVDSVAYSFEIWENTITSRFWFGSFIGGTAAIVLGTDRPKTLNNLFNHGTA
jgi:uncharacterized membrane protein